MNIISKFFFRENTKKSIYEFKILKIVQIEALCVIFGKYLQNYIHSLLYL